MTQNVKSFSVTEPRNFDGDPYEVAERACRQAAAVAGILAELLPGAELMARNAQLSRNLQETSTDARATEWEPSLQGRKFAEVAADVEAAQKNLALLAQVAGFNPKAPLPKED